MDRGKILIVFFSRTGSTRKVAEAIHRKTGGEVIELTTQRYARGVRGYFQATLDAALGRAVPIKSKQANASSYDWVIIGSPIWDTSLSTPVLTYMSHGLPQAKHVAFFLTCGKTGAHQVFKQMENLYKKHPQVTLHMTASEIHSKNFTAKLEHFVHQLKSGRKELSRAA